MSDKIKPKNSNGCFLSCTDKFNWIVEEKIVIVMKDFDILCNNTDLTPQSFNILISCISNYIKNIQYKNIEFYFGCMNPTKSLTEWIILLEMSSIYVDLYKSDNAKILFEKKFSSIYTPVIVDCLRNTPDDLPLLLEDIEYLEEELENDILKLENIPLANLPNLSTILLLNICITMRNNMNINLIGIYLQHIYDSFVESLSKPSRALMKNHLEEIKQILDDEPV